MSSWLARARVRWLLAAALAIGLGLPVIPACSGSHGRGRQSSRVRTERSKKVRRTPRRPHRPRHPRHVHSHPHPHGSDSHHHHPHPHPHLDGVDGHHHPY